MYANQILITGHSGSGKTTIIKRLAEDLSKHKIKFTGFYTEECRDDNGIRNGFDLHTLNGGERAILARIGMTHECLCKHLLGKYCVHVEDFESLALPILKSENLSHRLLIIDEIGKMELYSKKFHQMITKINEKMGDDRQKMIATIPFLRDPVKHIPIVEQLKAYPATKLFTITKNNRDDIYGQILQAALQLKRQ